MKAVDLFGGPGGWDEGALPLGIRPVGVEWDGEACATRAAAGHETVQADVSQLDPAAFAPCELLIASPPCPTFSSAGDGAGSLVVDVILHCLNDLHDGHDRRDEYRRVALERIRPTAKTEKRAARDAAMSILVVEPLRWALALRPRLIAVEQVPAVLPIWEHTAGLLRRVGYSAWCGILTAEMFGVPQTRARAILVARLDGRAVPPRPTHRRFVPAPKLPAGQDSLFEMPRGRIVAAEDEALLPWISMADALGWGADGRVGFPRLDDRDGGEQRERDYRDLDQPAGTLTETARSWSVETLEQPARTLCGNRTPRWAYRGGSQENATERDLDEPAPTLLFGHSKNDVSFVRRERSGDRSEEGFDPAESPSQAVTTKARCWTIRTGTNSMSESRDPADMTPYDRDVEDPAPTLRSQSASWKVGPDGEHVDPPMRWKDRPAPTITTTARSDEGGLVGRQMADGEGRNVGGKNWVDGRPATTVAGDRGRLPAPGHKRDRTTPDAPGRQEGAVRITIEEASILQSFRPDYPWQGSRTKQFEQVGNAVPPLLARAVLEALIA